MPLAAEVGGLSVPDDAPAGQFRLRSYQAEMVEESLKANIICVMDTGSGKTHIAIERTRAELETCQPNKLVWFLAPTVPLCEQQYDVFKSNLPGYGIQILSGNDDVDHWTDQSIWDDVLHNIRIVLSTHQVLLDALTHAFVQMRHLGLIIFDEAHHCTLKHPAHRIMSDFYMPRVSRQETELPKILGLSASPVMKAKASSVDLQQIEQNLCATARTPKMHRTELLRYVHQPELLRIDYSAAPSTVANSKVLSALRHLFETYDLRRDPYHMDLVKQQQDGYDVSKQIAKVFLSGKTYCRDQLKSLVTKAEATLAELGLSPTEWYLMQCVMHFQRMVRASDSQLFNWSINEKQHLSDILSQLLSACDDAEQASSISLHHISPKVVKLVDVLVAEFEQSPEFTGLVFVEQRVWVAALAEILSIHPRTKDLFRIGTFVGTSQSSKRKANVATFAEPKNQQTTLDDFRAGKLNLILATSVLEEGIDISSCHLVVCFERPKNLKSFVQRRGRARKLESRYIIFTPDSGSGRPPESWQTLEDEMKAAYRDDMRQVELAEKQELQDEDGERFFEVPSTGALLTLHNATQHLYHFCAILSSGPFIDTRPEFDFTRSERGGITAVVTLPILVDPSVRVAPSAETWLAERMARKDAAFEAYKALFNAGLVNENLLPATQEADDALSELHIPDHTPAMVQPELYHRVMLDIQAIDEGTTYVLVLLPTSVPPIPDITLYWNRTKHLTVTSSYLSTMQLDEAELTKLRSITYKILYSVFQGRMEVDRDDFPHLLCPCDSLGHPLSSFDVSDWQQGLSAATDLITRGTHDLSHWGLISQHGDARKYIAQAIAMLDTQPILQVVRFPKRRDFLHPLVTNADGKDAYTKIEELLASDCVVDAVPTPYTLLALLFPSILHKIELGIITDTLRTTILGPVEFEAPHVPFLIKALTSSATDEQDNYQRLEFLGDCILKYIATIHLMANNLVQPESFLTSKKGKIVSNGFLARATMAAGLDRFIITKRFTGAKWSPRYINDLILDTNSEKTTDRSSKLLADVVESLIGVSYVIGGFDKAFRCIETLLPLEKWTSIPSAVVLLHEASPKGTFTAGIEVLENLIGYAFGQKGILLEALTHPSYKGPHVHCSYERLEFLGDAVLDYIVSKRLYAHESILPHQKMHAIRTATVNASFLAFHMFETTVAEEMTNKTTKQRESESRALWQFLRSGEPALINSRDLAIQQHQFARVQISAALEGDARYPWHVLALTTPPKFLSDIVESVIGAIYIDSHGDINACDVFVQRLGILGRLERILRDEVDCLHPKERLGHLAVEKDVRYVCTKDAEDVNDRSGGTYSCQVQVGGANVGQVVRGLNKLNAETIAAWRAVEILEGQYGAALGDASEDDEFFDADDGGGVMLEDM
ncbi:dicer-like protein 2 [Setomelanomma holmii]|uniref:Dicer-like protein 2 n=1 Tax=Setomelanomma holmii TaxID=210430 RepID=A0A9P4H6H2_9PLEO|nr:dicer-like protein 2 [Setomelanomma holmii]